MVLTCYHVYTLTQFYGTTDIIFILLDQLPVQENIDGIYTAFLLLSINVF